MLYLPTRLPVEAGHDIVADKSDEGSASGHCSADEAWEASVATIPADELVVSRILASLTEEQVLSRAAGILHGRVKAMVDIGRQQPARLPSTEWMTSAESVTDVSLPTFLLSVITGAAYVPGLGESGADKHWRRSLSLTHDILGCAGHTKNAKWDAMALWLRTTVRQAP